MNKNVVYRAGGVSDDPRAVLTTYKYDEADYLPKGLSNYVLGYLTMADRWSDDGGGDSITRIGWNATGQKIYMIDPMQHANSSGHTADYVWDGCSGSLQSSTSNALDQATSGTYDCNSGLLKSIKDANSQTTKYSYDVLGRITSATFPDGGSTLFSYDDLNRQVVKTVVQDASGTNQTTTVQFDGVGRPSSNVIHDPAGDVTVATAYDELGRVASVSNPYRTSDSGTPPVSRQYYDALGRSIFSIDQGGGVTATCYNGLAGPPLPNTATLGTGITNCPASGNGTTNAEWTATTDAAGATVLHSSDALGRLVGVKELGSSPSPYNLAASYIYDALGNLSQVYQAGAGLDTPRSRIFSYDSLSRLTGTSNPESGGIGYTYDFNGNVKTKMAPQPNAPAGSTATAITTYTYDFLNRLTKKAYTSNPALPPDPTKDTPPALFSYDSFLVDGSKATGAPYSFGRLTETRAGDSNRTLYEYDKMGRIASTDGCWNGYFYNCGTWSVRDLAGNITELHYGSGDILQQTWDAAGHLTNSSTANQYHPGNTTTILQHAMYLPDGSPASLSVGNGALIETFTKNAMLQMHTMDITSLVGPFAGNRLLSHTYCYAGNQDNRCPSVSGGNNGNIAGIVDNYNQARDQTFTYDGLNRISTFSLNGVLTEQYGIDSFDNMAKNPTASLTDLFDASNRLKSMPCAGNGSPYDAAGNQLCGPNPNGGFLHYVYDAENRVYGVYTYNNVTDPSYTYDYDGMRVTESDNSSHNTNFFYADGKQLRCCPGRTSACTCMGSTMAAGTNSGGCCRRW